MRQTGKYIETAVGGERVRVFVPHPLPPEPNLVLTNADYDLMEKANRALGRLDGVMTVLPDASLFLYYYVRKEAVLSSQIEGTQSSLSDLLLHESNEKVQAPLDDVREISNYVEAMHHALDRIRVQDFPVSSRLIRETHARLLAGGRGSTQNPGEFRTSQNWIGGTRPGTAVFVPPPPDRVAECMGALEMFLHDKPSRTPVLIKAALAHVQFETIHPFLDGNGRIGRLLITLLLCAENVLRDPLLYLSLYFKRNRQQYYGLLQTVREKGDWEGWMRFFLTGIYEVATQAVTTSQRILGLFDSDQNRIASLGRSAFSTHRVHQAFRSKPILSIRRTAELTRLTQPTVSAAVNAMTRLGMLQEITGRRRDRLFAYKPYLDLLNEGTELPSH